MHLFGIWLKNQPSSTLWLWKNAALANMATVQRTSTTWCIREAFTFCLWEREMFYLVIQYSIQNLVFSPRFFFSLAYIDQPSSVFFCSAVCSQLFDLFQSHLRLNKREQCLFFFFISFIVPYNTVNIHPPNLAVELFPHNEVLTLRLLGIFHLASWKKAPRTPFNRDATIAKHCC